MRLAIWSAGACSVTRELVIMAVANSVMFFTNFEGFYAAHEALDDLLDAWDH